MAGFKRPDFPYSIDVAREVDALRAHKQFRGIPKRDEDHLLLATWNIANLGATEQLREPECFELLAEVIGYFDLVAVQEVRDNVTAARRLLAELPDSWRLIFSEAGGNDERFGFFWDSEAVELGQLVGKMAIEARQLERAGGQGFTGFSRTPYLATFHKGPVRLELASVHSIFGDKEKDPFAMMRRLAETKAIGWWCEERSKDPDSYTKDIIALGDFNTPSEDDAEFAAEMLDELRARGLHALRYKADGTDRVLETQLGTAVRSENHYDHLLFFPRHTDSDLEQIGVFDFDDVVFHDLWTDRGRTDFHNFTIWALSDHRPLWAQLRTR